MNHLDGYDDPTGNVLESVRLERAKQWQVNRLPFNTDRERHALLSQAAREIEVGIMVDCPDTRRLRHDLIQLAAVAVAWVEAIDLETR